MASTQIACANITQSARPSKLKFVVGNQSRLFYLHRTQVFLSRLDLYAVIKTSQARKREGKNRECRAKRQLPRNCEQRCFGSFVTLGLRGRRNAQTPSCKSGDLPVFNSPKVCEPVFACELSLGRAFEGRSACSPFFVVHNFSLTTPSLRLLHSPLQWRRYVSPSFIMCSHVHVCMGLGIARAKC